MDKKFAMKISRTIKRSVKEGSSLDITGVARNTLPPLRLRKDHDILSSWKTDDEYGLFYVLICDWRLARDYYLMVFGKFHGDSRICIVFEIHETDTSELYWTYTPIKRDDGNEERKKRFKTMYGPLRARISLPSGDIS